MRRSIGGAAACVFLGIGMSFSSCALDEREIMLATESLSPGANGAAYANGLDASTGPGASVEEDRCNGDEACADTPMSGNEGAVLCPGCSVQGECFAAGELNPGNSCQVCTPALDATGWSSNEGVACDDGLFCSVEDVCVSGACVGSERPCDDGVACNGVSVCLEEDDACSPNQNECNDGTLCDVQTGDCVATCEGCAVDGSCLPPGGAAAQNPCLVCDPARSATSLSAAEGQPCGASPTECSGQDTCSAQGECQPNHFSSGEPCGAAVANECDAADACDGNGQCIAQRADNGSPCEDGLFCTTGGQCQAGTCVGTGPRRCATNERCDEQAGRCTCAGCSINGTCVAAGAINPANACQICDPARNVSAYSANLGANCGSTATACSGQDTCNAQGQCAPNHLAAGTACGAPGGDQCDVGDSCDGSGQCIQRVAQNGDPCDDGQFCTDGDTCQGGACRAGPARNCGANQTCDEGANQCRCTGCLVNGNCFAAGALNPGNPCQICNPAQNALGFVGNLGASCGSAATACSDQDTCNAQGQCQANHLAQGTICGAPVSGECDAADSCDGNGQCIARTAANNASCEDGLFCTQGDRCQSGGCVAGGSPCGNRPCDEAANRCGAADGERCTADSDCSSGACRFPDSDGDTFGNASGGLCGVNRAGFVARGGDCCDVAGSAVAAQINPAQEAFFDVRQSVCPQTPTGATLRPFDYNCSGVEEAEPLGGTLDRPSCASLSVAECQGFTWSGGIPACGATGDTEFCGVQNGVCTAIFVVTAETLRRCH